MEELKPLGKDRADSVIDMLPVTFTNVALRSASRTEPPPLRPEHSLAPLFLPSNVITKFKEVIDRHLNTPEVDEEQPWSAQ